MPPPAAYFEPINWHRTALHELAHASGHFSRLNRDLSGDFGTRKYAFEEIIAEITSAFCCASLGVIQPCGTPITSAHGSRSRAEDNRAIVRAASQASKAADYLLGFLCQTPRWVRRRRRPTVRPHELSAIYVKRVRGRTEFP